MASSTVTRSSTELTDDVDETPLDDEDFDLDDEGDDDADTTHLIAPLSLPHDSQAVIVDPSPFPALI